MPTAGSVNEFRVELCWSTDLPTNPAPSTG
jgi:hypothetical protein